MNALEFSTKIEKGLIKVPREFKNLDNAFVRIIILSENAIEENIDEKKKKLKAAFMNLNKVKSLANIENPVEWQQELRNEWE
jgi:hypothetical protein